MEQIGAFGLGGEMIQDNVECRLTRDTLVPWGL